MAIKVTVKFSFILQAETLATKRKAIDKEKRRKKATEKKSKLTA